MISIVLVNSKFTLNHVDEMEVHIVAVATTTAANPLIFQEADTVALRVTILLAAHFVNTIADSARALGAQCKVEAHRITFECKSGKKWYIFYSLAVLPPPSPVPPPSVPPPPVALR